MRPRLNSGTVKKKKKKPQKISYRHATEIFKLFLETECIRQEVHKLEPSTPRQRPLKCSPQLRDILAFLRPS
jgi:hypothetical protein